MFDWIVANAGQIALVIIAIEKVIRLISKITPWKWDDDIADWLAKVINAIKPNQPPTP